MWINMHVLVQTQKNCYDGKIWMKVLVQLWLLSDYILVTTVQYLSISRNGYNNVDTALEDLEFIVASLEAPPEEIQVWISQGMLAYYYT